MRALAVAALAAAIIAACIKSAHDLAPFPCAADRTCPGGLACAAGSSGGVAECAPATLDSTCTSGSDPTDCAAAGGEVVCSASLAQPTPTGMQQLGPGSPIVPPIGACETACPCGSGRTCVDSICLLDCTASASVCPSNTTCQMGLVSKFCVPAGLACAAVQLPNANPRCTSQLCTARTSGATCPDGQHTCPGDSTCSDASTSCTCNVGRAPFQCANDTPCAGTCAGGSYWCAPDITTVTCQSDLDGLTATCACWGGRTIPVSCNVGGKSCEDLCADR